MPSMRSGNRTFGHIRHSEQSEQENTVVTITEEQSALVESVRTYCEANTATVAQRDALTEGGTESTSTKTVQDMGERGWLGISLPEEYGGLGGSFFDEVLFLEASSRGLAPINAYGTGLTAAQTYLKWGTDEQRTTVCTNLANGRLEAISLSEPGTGSDLGAVTCKGERNGDEYVINGQKTWCTAAHLAENLLVLVREETTEKKHERADSAHGAGLDAGCRDPRDRADGASHRQRDLLRRCPRSRLGGRGRSRPRLEAADARAERGTADHRGHKPGGRSAFTR